MVKDIVVFAVSTLLFFIVKRYKDSDRALVVQIGNKIRLEHNNAVEADEYDYWKGWTLEINPFKDIS